MSTKKNENNPNSISSHIDDDSRSFQNVLSKYYGSLYNNFDKPEIQARIVNIDIILQLIQDDSHRNLYKIYIQPQTWLPQILIKNPASFFVLCTIHGFLPNVESIIVQDSWKKINLLEYQHLIAVTRMIQLFFVRGFDFVLYDVINKILQNAKIRELFRDSGITQLNQNEILAMSKILEDIKKVWFDNHKHHFHEDLGKLFNVGAFSENLFLEVAIKFENNVREIVGYESTYIKPASFVEDTQHKTDFNRIYCINSKEKKYNDIPIQFTSASDEANNKLNSILQYFRNSNLKEFVFIKIDGKFRENVNEIISIYRERIENAQQRQTYDPTVFPLFINHHQENIDEIIIAYVFLHHIMKRISNWKWNFIPNLKCVIWNIDFKEIKIQSNEQKFRGNGLSWFKYKCSKNEQKLCEIFYIKKSPSKQIEKKKNYRTKNRK